MAMADARVHSGNVSDNLQLIADFACATLTLFVPCVEGLQVKDSVCPSTFSHVVPARHIGSIASHTADAEAYECFSLGRSALAARTSDAGGISFVSYFYPIGKPTVHGVLVRDVPAGVSREFGAMEEAFVDIALHLIKILRTDALRDAATLMPFSTTHTASDMVIYLGPNREVLYSTPNVGSLLPGALHGDIDGALSRFPEYEHGVVNALVGGGCSSTDIEVDGIVLSVRMLPCKPGAVVLMEDVTELRTRERELRVKEATIREVHHRVKNNLQTIESLLRMQMRRTGSMEVIEAFSEAITRIGAMSVAHEMLSYSHDESVAVLPLVRAVAEQVKGGLVGANPGICIEVRGDVGTIDAQGASSFALAIAEIVHNAIEHGFEDRASGVVSIELEREGRMLTACVEDNGCGLPEGFSLEAGTSMGLMLVRTLVEDDLSGSTECGPIPGGSGTRFVVTIPLSEDNSNAGGRLETLNGTDLPQGPSRGGVLPGVAFR